MASHSRSRTPTKRQPIVHDVAASSSDEWSDFTTTTSGCSSSAASGCSSDAKPTVELRKWQGDWRRIGLDDFDYNYRRHARHPGYAVQLNVLLFEHYHCNCHRSDNPEKVLLFLPHISDMGKFPVKAKTSNGWLDYANEHGFGCTRPGFIVEVHGISYGCLRRLPTGLIVCQ